LPREQRSRTDVPRVEEPRDIVGLIKEAVATTETGVPFLLEFVVR
jgi:hypothetical protein